jgi:hypothetical protein
MDQGTNPLDFFFLFIYFLFYLPFFFWRGSTPAFLKLFGFIHTFKKIARHQRLTPVILATQEAEIRRIVVQSQAWANSSMRPCLEKNLTKK